MCENVSVLEHVVIVYSIGHLLTDLSYFSSDRNNSWPIFLINELLTVQTRERQFYQFYLHVGLAEEGRRRWETMG